MMIHYHLLSVVILADERYGVRDVIGLSHALARILNFADYHVNSVLLVMIRLLLIFRRPVVTSITFQFLMQIIHSL